MTSKAVIEDVFPWVDLALTDIKAVNRLFINLIRVLITVRFWKT